ncbi:DedA family protein [Streptomyces sp. NPDC057877]|uniref:DedA family protein n=1 Tax=Streptomyces sp. NPDC057877 TaxID=3346269 RepID=UPI0036B99AF8
MTTLALGPSWLDPNYLLDTFGIWGLLLIVFAESGLLIGFFLPGDSLLFTAGLLITSNQLDFPLWAAIVLICIAAILGDQAGYMFGKKVGPALFTRPDSRLFKQENVVKAHEFFEKYGPKSLVLARFVPIVRTFTPIIAGVSGMRYRSFLIFNVLGGILWGAGVTILGAWLGNIDFVKKNIEAILILIVFISVVPIIIELLRARSQKKKGLAQEPESAAHGQQAPHQAPHQAAYQQQPVMDDATTQLRRIPPTQQNQGYGDQGYSEYDDQGFGDQQYGDQGYGNQRYGNHQGAYQQPQPQPDPYQGYNPGYAQGQGHGQGQGQGGYDQHYGQQPAQPYAPQYPQGQGQGQNQGQGRGQDPHAQPRYPYDYDQNGYPQR